MQNVMIQTSYKNNKRDFYKETTDLEFSTKKYTDVKFFVAKKMVNTVSYDMEKITSLMVEQILEGLLNGRKEKRG